jgi:hypothetical protein
MLFGKKIKRRSIKKTRKVPKQILRMCKKLKIKCTHKIGKRRVYKPVSVLRKLIKRKMRKHKTRKNKKTRRRVRYFSFGNRKKSRFGGSAADFNNAGPSNYGYNQNVNQYPGTLSQTSQYVTSSTNASRPPGFSVPDGVPVYGVGRPFFNETVPTQVPPNWNFMGQPDGSLYAVGGPFTGYKSPAFGKKRRMCTRCYCKRCKC